MPTVGCATPPRNPNCRRKCSELNEPKAPFRAGWRRLGVRAHWLTSALGELARGARFIHDNRKSASYRPTRDEDGRWAAAAAGATDVIVAAVDRGDRLELAAAVGDPRERQSRTIVVQWAGTRELKQGKRAGHAKGAPERRCRTPMGLLAPKRLPGGGANELLPCAVGANNWSRRSKFQVPANSVASFNESHTTWKNCETIGDNFWRVRARLVSSH